MVRKYTNNNKKSNKKKTNKPKKDPNVIDNGKSNNSDDILVEGQPILDKKDFADFMKKSLQDNPQDFIKGLLQDLTNDKAAKLIGTNPDEYKDLLNQISGPNNEKLDQTIDYFTQCMMKFIQVNDGNDVENNGTESNQ